MDMKQLADVVAATVRGYVERALAPIAERLTSLEARPIPEPGEKGDRGEQGERGEPGALGPAGPAGDKGDPGARGEKGDPGTDGTSGKDGVDGRDGRDALQIEIIDGLDPQRRYQRGTFASYRGGLVRAFRATDPIDGQPEIERAGWQVIVNGICDVELELDGRNIRQIITPTSGKPVVKSTRVPMMVHVGPWSDKRYEAGDTVACGGDMWLARCETSRKPGGNDDWLLVVRKGRDGKDGKNGERGPPGPTGQKGRDLTQLGADGSKW